MVTSRNIPSFLDDENLFIHYPQSFSQVLDNIIWFGKEPNGRICRLPGVRNLYSSMPWRGYWMAFSERWLWRSISVRIMPAKKPPSIIAVSRRSCIIFFPCILLYYCVASTLLSVVVVGRSFAGGYTSGMHYMGVIGFFVLRGDNCCQKPWWCREHPRRTENGNQWKPF